ncbi:hypothetical protein HanXRQr2_Chr05g0208401 [Helianthus annuus]|uniref:Uncharacterized protein n=1 Tax=Helianthus annuus TaxID=4232 RepID=A0A251UN89_HELAN|nr:hypothetical protein HanXRQr2_Chr05g0208401 [Helianthus annuus]KAJ0922240.1 hypothetical protein HanPSC8_Chr05g0201381 [Helianthus annuus]
MVAYKEAWCLRIVKDLTSTLLTTRFSTSFFPSLELVVVAQQIDQEIFLLETHHCEFMSPFSLNCFQFFFLNCRGEIHVTMFTSTLHMV